MGTMKKCIRLVIVLSFLALSFVDAESVDQQQHGTDEANAAIDALLREEGHRELEKEKPHFVYISLDPFSGNGSIPIPIDSQGFLVEPGSTVVLLEQNLPGTATYHYSDWVKKIDIIAVMTGSCTVVDAVGPLRGPETSFVSHCTVCVTYKDECAESALGRRELWKDDDCSHPACGFITATGDIFSSYEFGAFGPVLVDSEARLLITGGAYDLNNVIGGLFDMYHDGQWNMKLKVPLTKEASCKLQDREFFY